MFCAVTAVLNAMPISREKAAEIFDYIFDHHDSDGTILFEKFLHHFQQVQKGTGFYLEPYKLKHRITFADVALVLSPRNGVAVISYCTTSMTSHTISIDIDNCLILDPDKRNNDVMNFTSFQDDTYMQILEKLNVFNLDTPVVSHVYFVRRKKGRHEH